MYILILLLTMMIKLSLLVESVESLCIRDGIAQAHVMYNSQMLGNFCRYLMSSFYWHKISYYLLCPKN